MKLLTKVICFICFLIFTITVKGVKTGISKPVSVYSFSDTCKKNVDDLYNRKQILDTLAAKLNYLSIYYKVNHPIGYSVTDESFYNFLVYDLIDTTNNTKSQCIQFLNNHVYHFSSINARFLYSNILILNNGKQDFFLGINCKNKINTIEEVIGYLRCQYKDDTRLQEIIERVKKYKSYGLYYRMDPMSGILCEEG